MVRYIPLCLNRKFRISYWGAAPNALTSNCENFSSCSLISSVYRIFNGLNGRFPYWIHCNFWRSKSWRIPLAKVIDFERLGALFALGGLKADLLRGARRICSISAWWTCKILIFHWTYCNSWNWRKDAIHQARIFISGLKHSDLMTITRNCKFLIFH